jgi:hypothetical protein
MSWLFAAIVLYASVAPAAISNGQHGWTWTGPEDETSADLRKIGSWWMHVERATTHDNMFVGIYTEAR